uniref:Uncharacterized protein n=1 Tax=Mesocestoides corti TaxID=53468 RepID=A0A5K3FCE2_MESCO
SNSFTTDLLLEATFLRLLQKSVGLCVGKHVKAATNVPTATTPPPPPPPPLPPLLPYL